MPLNLPYLIFGTITESGTGVDSATVKLRNESNNELLSTTTDSSGRYIFDSANFTSGYLNGQSVTVYTLFENFNGSSTHTIDVSGALGLVNIALSAVADSSLISYTTVQYVWDELDGKTSADISAERIIRAVQRAEGIIDLKTNTSFKSNTATNETHTVHRYNIGTSPDFLDTFQAQTPLRADRFTGGISNSVKVDNTPIISITTFQKNGASGSEADSWTTLTEQTGSSGDFIVENKDAGIIDFLSDFPRYGKRSWRATYTWGHDPTSTDRKIVARIKTVERLATLLAAKAVVTTKATGTMFDSIRDVRIGTIELRGGGATVKAYLSSVDLELALLWDILGDLGLEII
ncbi:hypothetical protein LCGC14_1083210 [marine sediment metagenome]|uniref:Uncharacterized protein n=1 Tax=marine sediment metagenome TaxID=412755 RepID=A0A0F9PXU6_9ZZZZ